ncbi:MAG: PhnP protein [Rhodospirillaceae bacterium]|nr:MAG: PhnP protein [Rhodospirillaceae bacterium]
MRITILGCGGAGGVPTISRGWGACDPANPRNRRRRPAILVQSRETAILVDTPPDLRDQLLDAGIRHLDAVLYTHEHADHVHGLDDLREVNRATRKPIPVHAAPAALQEIVHRFAYAFSADAFSADFIYRPALQAEPVTGSFYIHDMRVEPFEQDHGFSTTLGFRFGQAAYSTDVVALPEAAFAALEGVRVWIIGCLTGHEHKTHASLDTILQWVQRVQPDRAILTHMGPGLDYATLKKRLPSGIEPAFDGMVIGV